MQARKKRRCGFNTEDTEVRAQRAQRRDRQAQDDKSLRSRRYGASWVAGQKKAKMRI